MSTPDCLVGIDPGLDGALAFLDMEGTLLATYRMPTYMLERSADVKRMLDEDGVTAILKAHKPTVAWIEDVWSSSQMGPVSIFTFGEGKGILKGACAGLGIERRYVPPATWKGVLGVSADKKTSKRRAHGLFPGKAKLLTSADKCEAALIGLYGLCVDGGPIAAS
jgi:Holliday junction resolvasome RuvABC endonuclease subunit